MNRKPTQHTWSVKQKYDTMKNTLEKDDEDFLERLLQITNQGFQKERPWDEVEQLVLDEFYNVIFVEKFKTISKYFYEAHGIKINIKNIDFDKLLYSEDGLEFEERIHKHILACKNGQYNLINIGNVYEKILKTETSCLFHGLQAVAFEEVDFTIFLYVGGCEKCIGEFMDNELYRWDECGNGEAGPPYHPNCSCFFMAYEADEDEKRDLFPEYFPEDEDDFEEEGY